MMRWIKMIGVIGALLGICACGTGGRHKLEVRPHAVHKELAGRVRDNGEFAVLFVGNSFSFGVPESFERMARRRGKSVYVDHVTHSSWTLERHVDAREAVRKIRERRWDVVVLQEQSRIPSRSASRRKLMFPNVNRLAAEARAQGAVPVLYQTWGYLEGDSYLEGDDFYLMSGRLREGYRMAAEKAGGLLVVPVGDAWELEMKAGRGERLFQEDGTHPSGAGDSVTVETFCDSLFFE